MNSFASKSTWPLAVATAATLFLGSSATAMAGSVSEDHHAGRNLLVYVPSRLPPQGKPALVVVLHGGMGNARRIESGQSEHGLNMDAVAEKGAFIVAYLNGTPVTRRLGGDKLGWNAGGGCCGQSAENNIDDVHYVQSAVEYLSSRYGIDRKRVYGVGHSNGAMMAQRMVCETDVFAAAVALSGPLNLDVTNCPAARGKRILAIHGAEDVNVPVAGGQGTGLSRAVFKSEVRSQQAFTDSGAQYTLEIVKGADHKLADIEEVIQRTQGMSIAEKAARFFGLLDSSP